MAASIPNISNSHTSNLPATIPSISNTNATASNIPASISNVSNTNANAINDVVKAPPKSRVFKIMQQLKELAVDYCKYQDESAEYVGPEEMHKKLKLKTKQSMINYLRIIRCMERLNEERGINRYTFDQTALDHNISTYCTAVLEYRKKRNCYNDNKNNLGREYHPVLASL